MHRLAMVIGFTLFGSSLHGQTPKIVPVVPDEAVHQWIVDEPSGRIFASMPDANKVTEYDSATGKEVRKFEIRGTPKGLAIKKHWLVVSSREPTALSVVDLRQNKVVGAVSLRASEAAPGLFCSKADNPYVYAIWRSTLRSRTPRIMQIDLQGMSILKEVTPTRWDVSDMVHAVMTPDGHWLLVDARGGHSHPTRAGLMRIDEAASKFEGVVSLHQSFGQAGCSPSGRWWTLGNALYPLELTRGAPSSLRFARNLNRAFEGEVARKYGGIPVAIHPRLDLAASLNNKALVLETFTEAKPIARIALDESPGASPHVREARSRGSSSSSRRRTSTSAELAGDLTLQYDLAADRVICGIKGQAYIVDMAPWKDKLAARLELVPAGLLNVGMNQKLRVPLKIAPFDAPSPSGLSFSIVRGPQFAAIDGGQLVLSPGDAAGQYPLTIKAALGTTSSLFETTVEVDLPNLDLGFKPNRSAIDDGGNYVALAESVGQNHAVSGMGPPHSELAVVDIRQDKIVVRTSAPVAIDHIAVDDKHLYASVDKTLYRFECTDLKKRAKRTLPETPFQLTCLPDHRLRVSMVNVRTPAVFDGESFEPLAEISTDLSRPVPPHSAYDFQAPAWLPEGAAYRPRRIVDPRTGALRCPLNSNLAPPLRGLENFDPRDNVRFAIHMPSLPRHMMSFADRSGGRLAHAWGRSLLGQDLVDGGGSTIVTCPGQGAICPQAPLMACTRSKIDREKSTQTLLLELRELKMGDVVWSHLFTGTCQNVNLNYVPENFGQDAAPMFAGKRVLVPVDTRLYLIPIRDEVLKKLNPPLYLTYPQIDVAGVDKPLEIVFSARCGERKLQYRLVNASQGMTCDADTGKVVVDLPMLWNRSLTHSSSSAATPPNAEQAANFKLATGMALPAGMMPFLIPLIVEASDSAGQKDRIEVAVVGIGPLKDLEGARAPSPGFRPNRFEPRPVLQPANPFEPNPASSLPPAEREQKLNQRLERLEKTMDAIMQKLDRVERSRTSPGPSGGPASSSPRKDGQ